MSDIIEIKETKSCANNQYEIMINNIYEKKKIIQNEFVKLITFKEINGSICGCEIISDLYKKLNNDSEFKKIFKKTFPNHVKQNKIINQDQIYSLAVKNFSYTEQQAVEVKEIIKFLYNGSQYSYGLYGFAGSGKTTMITQLLGGLLKDRLINSVVFTAPTNKAVNVMESKLFNYLVQLALNYPELEINNGDSLEKILEQLEKVNINIDFLTIHKLLDYKNDFGVKGNRVFIKGSNLKLPKYDLIIVDECSMIPIQIIIDLYEEIHKQSIDNYKRIPKLIFVGDPAQLPPVNEQVSIIFSNNENDFNHKNYDQLFGDDSYNDKGFFVGKQSASNIQKRLDNLYSKVLNQPSSLLTGIVRAKDINVVGLCQNIRKWVFNETTHPTARDYIGEFVKIYKNSNKWMDKFMDLLENNNGGIMLTWTNQACDNYNLQIRQKLFNKESLQRFEIGDLLILNNFYIIRDPNKEKIDDSDRFYTSEQIRVVKIEHINKKAPNFAPKFPKTINKMKNILSINSKCKNTIELINRQTVRLYKCWQLSIVRLTKETKTHDIYILENEKVEQLVMEDRNKVGKLINDLRKYFRQNYKDQMIQIDHEIIKPLWRTCNELFVEPFAEISYGYCITVHKSQGSGFNNVFVDIGDVLKNEVENEAKRCLYTALTRASHSIHMLV
jgi:hypothetical protein